MAVVGWALALAPIAAGHPYTGPPAGAPSEQRALRHHGHGIEPASDARGTPTDQATHDVHCLACLVGALVTLTPAAIVAGPTRAVPAPRPRVPLVADEHHRHVRSRAPPPAPPPASATG